MLLLILQLESANAIKATTQMEVFALLAHHLALHARIHLHFVPHAMILATWVYGLALELAVAEIPLPLLTLNHLLVNAMQAIFDISAVVNYASHLAAHAPQILVVQHAMILLI